MHLIIHEIGRDRIRRIERLDNVAQVVIHIPKWISFKVNRDKYGRLHITFE